MVRSPAGRTFAGPAARPSKGCAFLFGQGDPAMTRPRFLAALAAALFSGWALQTAAPAQPQASAPERRLISIPDGNLPADQLQKLGGEGWQLESIAEGAAIFTRKPVAARAISGSGVQIEMLDELGLVVLRGDRTKTQRIAQLLGRLERPAPRLSAGLDALVQERLATLRQLVGFAEEAFRSGSAGCPSVIEAQNALIAAELESATRRADRIPLLGKHVENLKRLEETAAAQQQAGSCTLADLLWAKAARLEAEIALGREDLPR